MGSLIPRFWTSGDDLWVSKPEWVLPYSSLAEAHVLRYTFTECLWKHEKRNLLYTMGTSKQKMTLVTAVFVDTIQTFVYNYA